MHMDTLCSVMRSKLKMGICWKHSEYSQKAQQNLKVGSILRFRSRSRWYCYSTACWPPQSAGSQTEPTSHLPSASPTPAMTSGSPIKEAISTAESTKPWTQIPQPANSGNSVLWKWVNMICRASWTTSKKWLAKKRWPILGTRRALRRCFQLWRLMRSIWRIGSICLWLWPQPQNLTIQALSNW